MQRRDLLQLFAACSALAGLDPHVLRAAAATTRGHAAARLRSALLDEHQRALVDQISELIMPATDTPGARAARVVDFVDVIVGEWYHDDERAAFLRGLADVDSRAQADFSKAFLDLTEAQQTAILTGLDAESRAMPPGSPPHFFSRIKGMTLSGYYSSEIGYTQELHGVLMPGRYDGAAPVRSR
ncbi:MAG TPA: gluconate 2-dehydrogenase subunit 3 family protein [Gemmatimonadales bacterium]|jgi:hypothetical protein